MGMEEQAPVFINMKTTYTTIKGSGKKKEKPYSQEVVDLGTTKTCQTAKNQKCRVL